MSGMVLITQEEYESLTTRIKELEKQAKALKEQEYWQCIACRYLNLEYRTKCRNCNFNRK